MDSHILTFDGEEYFQVEAAAEAGVTPAQWNDYPKRLAPAVDLILALLGDHHVSATFFILGWVAQNEAPVVRRIVAAGHEIASHGMTHAMIGRLSPHQFRTELLDSRKLLEDLSGKPVIGYRAPTFSITHATAWALDELAAAGYEYDCSVFPIRHDRYGVPRAPRWMHVAQGPGGWSILEIPPLTIRLPYHNLPVGGGGYFRLWSSWILAHALRKAQRAHRPGMIYLHPWEFDPDHPRMPLATLSHHRHRLNLHKTEGKLHHLLDRFKFTTARDAVAALRAGITETFAY